MPGDTRSGRRIAAWLAVGDTNWVLFERLPSTTPYLRHDQRWLQAPAIGGPWTAARTLPPSFGRLPAGDNWKDVRGAVLTRAASDVPTVFVSTVPAELILQRGAPETEPDIASRTGSDRRRGGGMRAGGGRRV